MTRIYLVRHCQALGNVSKRFQGQTDGDITDIGRHQLECLEARFKGVHVDKIYSSPLKRAYLTAEAIGRGCGVSEVIVDNGLIEINGGNLENHTVDEMNEIDPEQTKNWFSTFHLFSPAGGESTAHVYHRMYDTVSRLAEENDGKIIAIASHGCAIRCLMCAIKGLPIEKIYDNVGWVDNTGVCIIEYERGKYNIVCENDTSHYDERLLSERKPMWFTAADGE